MVSCYDAWSTEGCQSNTKSKPQHVELQKKWIKKANGRKTSVDLVKNKNLMHFKNIV